MAEFIVRPEEPGEEAIVSSVIRDAFGSDSVVHLVDALRVSDCWRDLSFVAAVHDKPVAHIAFTRGWLDTLPRLIEVLILSPVSVAPDWQRKGIGSGLITEALTRLQSREEPLVFLEGNPAFYSKVGFLPGCGAGFISPSLRIPKLAFQYVKLSKYEPWMTGTLVYPDVFWATDSVGLR